MEMIEWKRLKDTVEGVVELKGEAVTLSSGMTAQRHVRVDTEPFYAMELSATIEEAHGPNARVDVEVIKGDRIVASRSWTHSDVAVMNKIYVPIRPYTRLVETVIVLLRAVNMRISMLRGATEVAGDAPIYYGPLTTPVAFDREPPDGSLFRTLGQDARFVAASLVRKLTAAQS